MKTTEEILSREIKDTIHACLDAASWQSTLFFDIETTGLSPRNASIYLIGTAAFENGSWILRQWFAETLADEEDILRSFLEYASSFTHLIHFNGTTFDIPFVQARSRKYALVSGLTEMNQLDIYRQISPFKNALKLSNCRQKTLEEFLGIDREDPFSGGQLIELYKNYRQQPDIRLLKVLLLHNADDIRGMLSILPILSYPELLSNGSLLAAACVETGLDYQGNAQKELLLHLTFSKPIPVPFSLHKGGCYFTADQRKATAKIPVYCGELKYYYPDHKNYSYLPVEDNAIHKSVAVYVDKAHRVPATPENCYTRKTGEFIPCFCTQTKLPVFHKSAPHKKRSKAEAAGKEKMAAESNDFLFLEDSFLQDPDAVTAYGHSFLTFLLK